MRHKQPDKTCICICLNNKVKTNTKSKLSILHGIRNKRKKLLCERSETDEFYQSV